MSELSLRRLTIRFVLLASIFSVTCVFVPKDAGAQPEPIVVEEGMADEPSDEELGATNISDEMFTAEEDAPSIAGPSAVSPDDDDFFDAEALVPQGEMSREGPRKVNPALEPGSKYMIVRKGPGKESVQAQVVAAERALKLGFHDSALDMFENLYEENKRDQRVLMGKAVALQSLGRFDEAMKTYQELLNLSPENPEVKVNMLGLMATRYPAIALRQLKDLRQDYPEHVGIVAQLAVTEANLGNFREAIKNLGIASSMEPSNASHIFNMAVIADRAGETKTAISYYERALEVDTIYGAGRSIPREAVYERLAHIR